MSGEEKGSEAPLRVLLTSATGIVALLTVSLLALSVSHEWGYFWVVGSHFQTFVSTIDYLSNGVLWLPFALIPFRFLKWELLYPKELPNEPP